eukprot:GDKJ01026181.1.p1 GENE.GDKJ01026181.1~~GDKJ01026181.1.p1  ORF type:complete len:1394 (-),score=396.85 GDKJ01026181.1:38-4189(-)
MSNLQKLKSKRGDPANEVFVRRLKETLRLIIEAEATPHSGLRKIIRSLEDFPVLLSSTSVLRLIDGADAELLSIIEPLFNSLVHVEPHQQTEHRHQLLGRLDQFCQQQLNDRSVYAPDIAESISKEAKRISDSIQSANENYPWEIPELKPLVFHERDIRVGENSMELKKYVEYIMSGKRRANGLGIDSFSADNEEAHLTSDNNQNEEYDTFYTAQQSDEEEAEEEEEDEERESLEAEDNQLSPDDEEDEEEDKDNETSDLFDLSMLMAMRTVTNQMLSSFGIETSEKTETEEEEEDSKTHSKFVGFRDLLLLNRNANASASSANSKKESGSNSTPFIESSIHSAPVNENNSETLLPSNQDEKNPNHSNHLIADLDHQEQEDVQIDFNDGFQDDYQMDLNLLFGGEAEINNQQEKLLDATREFGVWNRFDDEGRDDDMREGSEVKDKTEGEKFRFEVVVPESFAIDSDSDVSQLYKKPFLDEKTCKRTTHDQYDQDVNKDSENDQTSGDDEDYGLSDIVPRSRIEGNVLKTTFSTAKNVQKSSSSFSSFAPSIKRSSSALSPQDSSAENRLNPSRTGEFKSLQSEQIDLEDEENEGALEGEQVNEIQDSFVSSSVKESHTNKTSETTTTTTSGSKKARAKKLVTGKLNPVFSKAAGLSVTENAEGELSSSRSDSNNSNKENKPHIVLTISELDKITIRNFTASWCILTTLALSEDQHLNGWLSSEDIRKFVEKFIVPSFSPIAKSIPLMDKPAQFKTADPLVEKGLILVENRKEEMKANGRILQKKIIFYKLTSAGNNVIFRHLNKKMEIFDAGRKAREAFNQACADGSFISSTSTLVHKDDAKNANKQGQKEIEQQEEKEEETCNFRLTQFMNSQNREEFESAFQGSFLPCKTLNQEISSDNEEDRDSPSESNEPVSVGGLKRNASLSPPLMFCHQSSLLSRKKSDDAFACPSKTLDEYAASTMLVAVSAIRQKIAGGAMVSKFKSLPSALSSDSPRRSEALLQDEIEDDEHDDAKLHSTSSSKTCCPEKKTRAAPKRTSFRHISVPALFENDWYDQSGQLPAQPRKGSRLKLIVDIREDCSKRQGFVECLKGVGMKEDDIEMMVLPVGDFSFCIIDAENESVRYFPILIERKTANDLSSSLTDGRYHEQRVRLARHAGQVYYLLEGDFPLGRSSDQADSTTKDDATGARAAKGGGERNGGWWGAKGYAWKKKSEESKNHSGWKGTGMASTFSSLIVKVGADVLRSKNMEDSALCLFLLWQRLSVSLKDESCWLGLKCLELYRGCRELPLMSDFLTGSAKYSEDDAIGQLARHLFSIQGVGEEASWSLALLYGSHRGVREALKTKKLEELQKEEKNLRGGNQKGVRTVFTASVYATLKKFYSV